MPCDSTPCMKVACAEDMYEDVCLVAGAAEAFAVMADAGLWHEAVHLGAACLGSSCRQPTQLLVR